MITIKPLREFTDWLDDLKDAPLRGVIVARLKRLERGLMGDVEPVGDAIFELRIHVGAGWRVYFTQHGSEIIVLLGGGSKRTQKKTSSTPRHWRHYSINRGNGHEQTYQGRRSTRVRRSTLPG